MTSKRPRWLYLLLILALLSGSLATQSSASVAGQAGPTVDTPGFYLVGSKNLDPALFHHAGDTQFFIWRPLNPDEGVFNWSNIDSYLATHAVNGKKVGIAIVPAEGRYGAGSMPAPGFVRGNPAIMYDGVTLDEVDNGGFEGDLAATWGGGAGGELRATSGNERTSRVIHSLRVRITACSTILRSSRTLPGKT